jgi:ribosomal protein S24E
MKLKIITDAENKLFNRREIEGEIYAESAPSRQEVMRIISEKFSANPEVIKIKTIKGKFGEKVFLIVANIYKSKEEKDKTELKKKKDMAAEAKKEPENQKSPEIGNPEKTD